MLRMIIGVLLMGTVVAFSAWSATSLHPEVTPTDMINALIPFIYKLMLVGLIVNIVSLLTLLFIKYKYKDADINTSK